MAIAMDTVAEPAVIPDLPQLEARLGERLLADRKLSPPDLDRAQGVQQTMGGRLSQLLVDLGLVSEVDVAQALAQLALGRKLTLYDRSLDMHVSNLRKKLGPHADGRPRILASRGRGYYYAP